MAMNKRIKKKWVAALRSGKYKQAHGVLREINAFGTTTGFCCLGVLCNLHAIEHPKIAKKEKNPKYYMGEKETLPLAVAKWAGIDPYGIIKGYTDLVTLNDFDGRSFKYIANVIEEHA